jgi:PAS domain S-box-containing protein
MIDLTKLNQKPLVRQLRAMFQGLKRVRGRRDQQCLNHDLRAPQQELETLLIDFHKMERRVDLLTKQLQASEARYRFLVDNQSELIYRWRPDGIITFVNEAYCRYFSSTPEQLIGQNFMAFIPQEDHAVVKAHVGALNTQHSVDTHERRIIALNGEIRWQRWTDHAIFNEQGGIIEIQSIGSDITEELQAKIDSTKDRDHLAEMVDARTSELEVSKRDMDAFTYSLAHDLRTPLRAITSFCQVLLIDATEKLSNDEIHSLSRIIAAAKFMALLIDDILRLATINRSELHCQNVDISAKCQRTMAILNQSETERSITWKITPGITIWADPKAASIVIDNLLENAWKFTRKNPNAYIEVGSARDRGMDVFYVKDNGVGFDMKYAARLFREFERLNSTIFDGTGIGLAAIRHIVERHGGAVWAHAVQGEGATFYVHFPKQEEVRKKRGGVPA